MARTPRQPEERAPEPAACRGHDATGSATADARSGRRAPDEPAQPAAKAGSPNCAFPGT